MQKLVAIYTEDLDRRKKTTRHFKMVQGHNSLPEWVRLTLDRGFANNATPDYWLSYHDGKRYIRVSGLFETSIKNPNAPGTTFWGDTQRKKNSFLLRLEGNQIKLVVYKNYYPFPRGRHPRDIAPTITQGFG